MQYGSSSSAFSSLFLSFRSSIAPFTSLLSPSRVIGRLKEGGQVIVWLLRKDKSFIWLQLPPFVFVATAVWFSSIEIQFYTLGEGEMGV